MRELIFVRPLSDAEGEALKVKSLRSKDAFVPHRGPDPADELR